MGCRLTRYIFAFRWGVVERNVNINVKSAQRYNVTRHADTNFTYFSGAMFIPHHIVLVGRNIGRGIVHSAQSDGVVHAVLSFLQDIGTWIIWKVATHFGRRGERLGSLLLIVTFLCINPLSQREKYARYHKSTQPDKKDLQSSHLLI